MFRLHHCQSPQRALAVVTRRRRKSKLNGSQKMAWRVFTSQLLHKFHFSNSNLTPFFLLHKTRYLHCFCRLNYVMCKVYGHQHDFKLPSTLHCQSFHSAPFLKFNHKLVDEPQDSPNSPTANGGNGDVKAMRKKLKGKRAVVRWLKFFRFKKKKEFQRMTTEERILYKLLRVRCLLFFPSIC